jgi:hypothetical protein
VLTLVFSATQRDRISERIGVGGNFIAVAAPGDGSCVAGAMVDPVGPFGCDWSGAVYVYLVDNPNTSGVSVTEQSTTAAEGESSGAGADDSGLIGIIAGVVAALLVLVVVAVAVVVFLKRRDSGDSFASSASSAVELDAPQHSPYGSLPVGNNSSSEMSPADSNDYRSVHEMTGGSPGSPEDHRSVNQRTGARQNPSPGGEAATYVAMPSVEEAADQAHSGRAKRAKRSTGSGEGEYHNRRKGADEGEYHNRRKGAGEGEYHNRHKGANEGEYHNRR